MTEELVWRDEFLWIPAAAFTVIAALVGLASTLFLWATDLREVAIATGIVYLLAVALVGTLTVLYYRRGPQ